MTPNCRRCERGLLPLALLLWEDQPKMGDRMCPLLHTVDRGYVASDTTEKSTEDSADISMGRTGNIGKTNPDLQANHPAGRTSRQLHRPTRFTDGSQQKSNQMPTKSQGKSQGKSAVQTSPFQSETPSFAPWPSLDSSAFTPTSTPSPNPFICHCELISFDCCIFLFCATLR